MATVEATATLADTLLDDLDDLSDAAPGSEEEEGEGDGAKSGETNEEGKADYEQDDCSKPAAAFSGDTTLLKPAVLEHPFLQNDALQKHLQRITLRKCDSNNYKNHDDSAEMKNDHDDNNHNNNNNNSRSTDDDDKDDYEMIVASNKFHNRLQDELRKAHLSLVQVYGIKFPELHDLLGHNAAMAYKTAVQIIQNETDLTSKSITDALQKHTKTSSKNMNNTFGGGGGGVFRPNQVIALTVASSTTQGRSLLTNDELQLCLELANYMDELDQVMMTLQNFVEERITGLAPSTVALIGPKVTSQLLALAGGLQELALIPACNLQVLGQSKATAASRAGLSSKTMSTLDHQQQPPHQGVLRYADIFYQGADGGRTANIPPPLMTKLLKQVAGKVALTARVDATNVQQGRPRSAAAGQQFRAEILQKWQKWQEPDQAPTKKALPKDKEDAKRDEPLFPNRWGWLDSALANRMLQTARGIGQPDLTVKKRRGGKRMRQLKARFEETALMKQANTRSFSTQAGEYGDDAMGLTLGLLDTEGDQLGNVRSASAAVSGQKRKMHLANTKQARKQRALVSKISSQQQQRTAGAGNAESGLASTVTFTPLQAMELVNPDAQAERIRRANQKWFADNAGFTSALPPPKNK